MESKITVVEMYDKDILKYKKKLRYNQIVGNVGSLTFFGSIAVGLGLAIAQPSEVAKIVGTLLPFTVGAASLITSVVGYTMSKIRKFKIENLEEEKHIAEIMEKHSKIELQKKNEFEINDAVVAKKQKSIHDIVRKNDLQSHC